MLVSKQMRTSIKIQFLIQQFGADLAFEFIDASDSIDTAFKNAIKAECVVDNFLLKFKDIKND